ncbi:MAG: hypothetical protein NWE93_14805 [Candidatus Bathyarchaeota archaeon]|nr:hypothetical protein [Candidatus Bathyarchaeota archaeon]
MIKTDKFRKHLTKENAKIALSVVVIISFLLIAAFLYLKTTEQHYELISSNSVECNVSGINISPSIYSPQNNLAILNEEASFDITTYNYTNDTLEVKLSIIGNDNIVYTENINISAKSEYNRYLRQTISYTGLWLVTASSNNTRMFATYSFQTVTNAQEANMQINSEMMYLNQQNSSDWSNTLASIAILVSVVSVAINFGVLGLNFLRYRKNNKKSVKRKRDQHINQPPQGSTNHRTGNISSNNETSS